MSQPAVHYRLGKFGLVNNCHREQVVDTEKIGVLHGMGLTTVGIALLLKTSVQTIADHLSELGLTDNYYQLTEIVNCTDSVTEGDRE